MSSILDQCERLFNTRDLYEVFQQPKTTSKEKLKKAYYKISLKVHPDKAKAKDRPQATEKFQLLSKLHQLLSDKRVRDIYDETGEIDEEDDFGLAEGKEWMDYWREMFPIVTVDDISNFEATYKGSEEELADLKAAYISSKGDMQHIIDSVMCASVKDEERFQEMLRPLIESQELPKYKKFCNETVANKKKRQSKAKKEAKEAEKAAKELNGGSLAGYNDLAVAMQRNKERRGGLLTYLEEKYGNIEDDDSKVLESKPSTSKKRNIAQGSKSTNSSSKAKRQKKV
ncbi:dnaJ homolog subfamily C member 9-like [Watersipora subatra]|uniref:dnaJ homolog subfamily C member 9-like n=1 Tax=Watersipora subatra TaxID=2589382 RepID=UPI00355B82FD